MGGLRATRQKGSLVEAFLPRGRSTGHGCAAQGVPRMEPGWLLGMPPCGEGKRVLGEGPVGLPYVLEGSEPWRSQPLVLSARSEWPLEAGWPAHPDHLSSPAARFQPCRTNPHSLKRPQKKLSSDPVCRNPNSFVGDPRCAGSSNKEAKVRFPRACDWLVCGGTIQSSDWPGGSTEGPGLREEQLTVWKRRRKGPEWEVAVRSG